MYSFSGLSGNLFPILVYDFKMRDFSFRVFVGYAMFEYCASRWGIILKLIGLLSILDSI